MSGIKVYIFDDNIRLVESMKLLFEEFDDLEFLGSSPDCSHVVEDVRRAKPEVVIMDIDMPNVNGIEGVVEIRKNFPTVQILMQTVFEDDEKVFNAIRSGANGYILKNEKPDKIIEAIHEVYNGGSPMTPNIARKVIQQFQIYQEKGVKTEYNLSQREKEVLALLVRGYAYKEIANELFISYTTVRSHMKKIYEKLHVASMTEAVAKALNEKLFSLAFIVVPIVELIMMQL
jgi:DNA-binding NarL/FixJ family response regulator